MDLKIKLLSPTAIAPTYATIGSSGMDVYADIQDAVVVSPGKRVLISTGIAVDIPYDHMEIQVRPRSGLALKNGITVLNSPGTVDHDYKKPVGVILINHGDVDFVVNHGDRIAQLVVCPVIKANIIVVPDFDDTGRGGFGSTGVGSNEPGIIDDCSRRLWKIGSPSPRTCKVCCLGPCVNPEFKNELV